MSSPRAVQYESYWRQEIAAQICRMAVESHVPRDAFHDDECWKSHALCALLRIRENVLCPLP